jgi:hypothetical protein
MDHMKMMRQLRIFFKILLVLKLNASIKYLNLSYLLIYYTYSYKTLVYNEIKFIYIKMSKLFKI